MAIEAGLDTGPVFASARTPIDAGRDRGRAARSAGRSWAPTCWSRRSPTSRAIEPAPQVGEPTYAEKLTVEEFELDPAAPPAELVRTVRAGNPRPGAWIPVDGKRLKVWRAHIDDGRFVPDEVQPEGKATDAVRRVAHRSPRRRHRSRDARRPARSRSRPWCGSRTVRTRTSCFPGCCARPGWSNASGRRPPSSSTARSGGVARSTRCSSRCSTATSTTWTRRCVPRSGSACTSSSKGSHAHAAVGETVGALGRVAPRAKGFVNAVLRRVADARTALAVASRRLRRRGRASARRCPTGSSTGCSPTSASRTVGPRSEIANEPPALTLRVEPAAGRRGRRRGRARRGRRRRRARRAAAATR